MFEIALAQGYASAASSFLKMSIAVERRQWPDENPLWQMSSMLRHETLRKVQDRRLSVDQIKEMPASELGKNRFGPF